MNRSRKLVAVANCILNVNSKIEGIAAYPAVSAIVPELIAEGYGIIQLPCIEQALLGIRRWGIVHSQNSYPAFRSKCRELLQPIVDQIEDFAANGYEIRAIIGVDGSPTCGVHYRAEGDWAGEVGYEYGIDERIRTAHMEEGSGTMMQVLHEMLAARGLDIPFCALDEKADTLSLSELFANAAD